MSAAPEPTAADLSLLRGKRVCIMQPALPRYRLSVFSMLARRFEIDLTIAAEFRPIWGSLKSERGDGSFRTIDAPIRIIGPAFLQPSQVRLASSGQFDAIIYNWNRRFVHLGRALATARRRGVATVLWGHGFSKRESALRRWLRNQLIGKADALLLYGHPAAATLAQEGFDPSRIFVAQNAIDHRPVDDATALWRSAAGKLAEFQRAKGLTDQQSVIFISRMEPDKRVSVLLDAFAILHRAAPACRLILVGDGSDVPNLKARARELGIDAATIFTGPIYEESQLAPWCLSAGVFAYPAAIGLSILHAFAYGLPVVTSDNIAAHNPEIESLAAGQNGLLAADGDPASFAAQINRILGGEADGFRTRARQTIDRPGGFTIETMTNGFAAALCCALRRHPPAR